MNSFKRKLLEEDGGETPATVSADIAQVPTKVGAKKPIKKKKITDTVKEAEITYDPYSEFTVADIAVLLSDADEDELIEIANYLIEEYYDEEDGDDDDYDYVEESEELSERKKKKIVWRKGKKKKVFTSTKKKAGFRLSGVKAGGKGGKEKFVSKAKRNKESLHKIIAKRKSKGKTRLATAKRKRTMRKSGR